MRLRSSRISMGAMAVAAVLALNGGLAGAAAQSDTPTTGQGSIPVGLTLGYDCEFPAPAGKQAVTVAVSSALPDRVTVGERLQLDALRTEFILPEPTVQALAALGEPATITGQAVQEVVSTQQGQSSSTPLTFALPESTMPATGPLALAAEATPPQLVPTVVGDLLIAVAAPELALRLKQANGEPAGGGEVAAKCLPQAGQQSTLGTISVMAKGTTPTDPDDPSSTPGQPDADDGATGESPDGLPPGDRPESGSAPGLAADRLVYIVPLWVTGDTTVKKLRTRTTIGPGAISAPELLYHPGTGADMTAVVGLPPVKSPFVGFDFMPTEGVVEFLPPGDPNGKLTLSHAFNDASRLRDVETSAVLRVHDVKVNGVPLDVGPNCRTAQPVRLMMKSPPNTLWTPSNGGPVATVPDDPEPKYHGFEIPPFTGCGVAENLDPLVTGLVSGPDNQAYLDLVPLGKQPAPRPVGW